MPIFRLTFALLKPAATVRITTCTFRRGVVGNMPEFVFLEKKYKSPSQGLTLRSECREYSYSLPSRKEEDESQGGLGGG